MDPSPPPSAKGPFRGWRLAVAPNAIKATSAPALHVSDGGRELRVAWHSVSLQMNSSLTRNGVGVIAPTLPVRLPVLFVRVSCHTRFVTWNQALGGGAMGETARMAPQRVKVSSRRQIAISAKAYKDMGFTEYALIEQTDEGLLIKPLKVEDERISLDVLRRLIVEGCEGEALVGC